MTKLSSPELAVAYQPIESLLPYSRNARTHSKLQIRQIAESIKVFGFTTPILTDRNNRIIAGHGRVAAAKILGINRVPTICLENLTEDEIRAYVIADNRLAEKAGWDKSILAIELQHLMVIEEDFDVTVTGFEVAEIDQILTEGPKKQSPEDVFEVDPSGPGVSQLGDCWVMGKHRLLCGDSLKNETFRTLMGGLSAHMVFVDPPYNVRIDGHVCGNGAVHHREFAMASGEMSEAEFEQFLANSLRLLAKYSVAGSIHFVCVDWRHMGELLAAGQRVYQDLLNLCVWMKDKGGMGSLYRSQHELVFAFRNGKAAHRNNIQLGRYGRNRTNVWQYPGVNTLSRLSEEGNLLALHPTVKPVALVADAILDCSARGDLILDSFVGSGTTVLAAERVGRICYGVEIDPLYVDVAVRRWQKYTGDRAVHMLTGKCFDECISETEPTHA